MINITKNSDCCGCGACANVCPKNCIQMTLDREGFYYPHINSSNCIACNLCENVCPIITKSSSSNPDKNSLPKTYAVINKDQTVRQNSSSGGIFTLIAEDVLAQKGIVFGAAMTADCRTLEHIAVTDSDDLYRLRGSKYLQSTIGNCYKQAKTHLDNGTTVLFTGTPCQIEGLKAFLRKDYDNLICMDIICHGVPSPKAWQKYLDCREEKVGSTVNNCSFRNKKESWKHYSISLQFCDNSTYSVPFTEDPYMKAFLQNLNLRPSCYECQFKKINRVSDITVADFWGIENLLPDMDDDKGTSAVMIHSPKGADVLARLSEKILSKPIDFSVIPKANPSMVTSSTLSPKREAFMNDLDDIDFDLLINKYVHSSFSMKQFVKKVLKKLKLL